MNKLPAWLRLTFKGRINRFRFIWYPFGLSLILSIPSLILLSIYGIVAMATGKILPIFSYILFALQIVGQVYWISFAIRRLQDLNRSGWFILPIVLPIILGLIMTPMQILKSGFFNILWFINFILAIYLVFFKGTKGDNKYGPDPLDYPEYEEYLKTLENNNSENPDTRFNRE